MNYGGERMYRKIENLQGLIGNTPMIEIIFLYNREVRKIYAKLESFNMTGSIKDRMAIHILKRAYESGELKKEDIIVEATSGNTGISFCAIGRALGHNVCIFMPDWMSEERKKIIRSFGAQIELVSKEEGGFLECIKKTEELANNRKDVFLPRQFSNKYNVEAQYFSTGKEIWNQLDYVGIVPDGFVAGVGTGGTVMGIGKYLKNQRPSIQVYPLEPLNSPTLSAGYKTGNHRIQGISDDFIPSIVDLKELNQIIAVDDGDAIIMAQRLASELGLGVGISSGANFLGAIKAQELLGAQSVIVTVFADDNKKYLSTDLAKEEPVKENFISTKIKLLGLKTLVS